MARVDLNIVDRGIPGSDWVKADQGLTANHLDKVMEMKTDNSGALNSLPTPFARFFVAKEAFRRVTEEHINKNKEAGYAYRQLVSDILDVYELLFNLKYHKNTWTDGQRIEIREWDSTTNLAVIEKKMPILYKSIYEYYKDDIKEAKLYFVVYIYEGKETLLACSSPLTGFITPPDMDKNHIKKGNKSELIFGSKIYQALRIRRKGGGYYFTDPKPRLFEDRDMDFRNYMFNKVFGEANDDKRLKEIRDYIRSFRDDPQIRNDFNPKLQPVRTDQNNDLIINSLRICSYDEIDVNSFFTSTIIRVPYRIASDNFIAVQYENDLQDRDYDYLLPFNPEVLNLFKGGVITSRCKILREGVKVFLNYNGKEYSREYVVEPFDSAQGKILNLEAASINFDLGLFPNILSPRPQENNYFKIMVVAADCDKEAPQFNIDKISLSFFNYKDDFIRIREADPDRDNFGVLPAVVRSRQKKDQEESGTKFYELFNSPFDAIEVNIDGKTGLLLPKWRQSQTTDATFTYAIDLGTSNTFISRVRNGENNEPELFSMNEAMVSYLHEPSTDKQVSMIRRIEDTVFEEAQKKVKTEFVPAMIDGKDYKFPIRTALCGIKHPNSKPRLFDDYNIAFFYEKLMSNDDQNIHTDIKWEQKSELLRIFVREILLIIKADILQNSGDLDRTRIIWFRPLSFMGSTRATYTDIWRQEPKNILGIDTSNDNNLCVYSESEAPYYYFKKKNIIANSDAVTVIDIGGGSTDFVYFKENVPQAANSVHFGCDVIWDNGFADFDNARDNGIFKKYAGNINFDNEQLQDLNNAFQINRNVKTRDIINFWLSNASKCDIISRLRDDFKPVFTYHLTSIIYYMASLYKDNGLTAPRTIVFSGNGSKYIDNFITDDKAILKKMIDLIFAKVFGGEHNVNVVLPSERKECTCYGGLYKGDEPDVPEIIYQGVPSVQNETVGQVKAKYDAELKPALKAKYKEFAELYADVLTLLRNSNIIDNTTNTKVYANKAAEDMGTPLDTYFRTQVKEKYEDEVLFKGSVFFLPIIQRIFELTLI